MEQLKKLKTNLKKRYTNFNLLNNFFKKYENIFRLPKINKGVKTAWLAYPLTLKNHKLFTRSELQIFLEKNGIQTRTVFTGNILKQPIMKNKKYKKHIRCHDESDKIMKHGMLLGCHHGLKNSEIKYIFRTIEKFLKNKTK